MRTLHRGDTGEGVKTLQTLLLQKGYTPGSIDGIFGPKTEGAVFNFQRDQGLVVDGIVGPITWGVLLEQGQDEDNDYYTIKTGDTLYGIARSQGISLQELLAANPGIDPYKLRIGQQIKLPKSKEVAHSVAGWIPYWYQNDALEVINNYSDIFGVFSPFWYGINPDGELLNFPQAESLELINLVKAKNKLLIPLITNSFDAQLVSIIINDPQLKARHIDCILDKVLTLDYAGIEIDYENLNIEDKEAFVRFVEELRTALSQFEKLLIVTVHAKTNPDGGWSGAAAHDYEGIGRVADYVRIMAYDYSWSGGAPGPIAPVEWVEAVAGYASTVIPRDKIVLGLPTYGYDWGQGRGTGITYANAIAIANMYQATIQHDPSKGPHFTYTIEGIEHVVWFIDAEALAVLLRVVNKFNLYGIILWHLGGADPQI